MKLHILILIIFNRADRKIKEAKNEFITELFNFRQRIYIDYYRDADDYYHLFEKVLKILSKDEKQKPNYSKITETQAIINFLEQQGYTYNR